MDVSSDSPSTVVMILPQEVFLVDATSSLHPFFMHRLDVGSLEDVGIPWGHQVTVMFQIVCALALRCLRFCRILRA